jgi:hypothetical protein
MGPGKEQKTQTQLDLVQAMKNSYCGRATFGYCDRNLVGLRKTHNASGSQSGCFELLG